jgi:hypothetical protein
MAYKRRGYADEGPVTATGRCFVTSVSFSTNALIWMVARGEIELPTRGFSVHVPKRAKYLTVLRNFTQKCPIFSRDTGR